MNNRLPPARITGVLILTAFLTITLALAVQGAYVTHQRIAATFRHQANIERAQLALESLQRLQIDEEDSLRGYRTTGDSFYVGQYQHAVDQFTVTESALRERLMAEGLKRDEALLEQYNRLQSQWRTEIAQPQLTDPGSQNLAQLDKRTKVFSDYENSAVVELRGMLADTDEAGARSTQDQIDRMLYSRAIWLLVFGLLAILFNAYRSQLNWQLEEERTTTRILQRAFRSEHAPLPNTVIGTAYLSASSHMAVGGDFYDVFRLSDTRALVLIADVSGKGIDAAVLTAFIKFTIRAIALRTQDPSEILSQFNEAFKHEVDNPSLFVSMFVGVLNTDVGNMVYASAGHDTAFVRRPLHVDQLEVTGPVLGVMDAPFGNRTVELHEGDVIVLATDGLTESRDSHGDLLTDSGALRLILESSPEPQRLADELVARVRKFARNKALDDLAVLVIRMYPPKATDAPR